MTDSKHATLRYSALRIGIFVICLVVIAGLSELGWIPAGIGASNPFWLFALAILISAPISFVVLNRQREAMAQQVGGAVSRSVEKTRAKIRANREMEDEADDRARAATAETDNTGAEKDPTSPEAAKTGAETGKAGVENDAGKAGAEKDRAAK